MDGDEFEWDEAKAESNLAKHAVSFETATSVFSDAFALELTDFDSQPGEVRFVSTGLVNGVLLTVVSTERAKRIRLISARKATAHEREEYYRSQAAE